MLSTSGSTDTETSFRSSKNTLTSPMMVKQQSSYASYQVERESEIKKLLSASLLELTNNPDNLENRQQIQALIPISVLLDEMRSDYSTTRTYCLENLDTIALALGPAKAKGLLGGFISNLLKDQDEGVEDVPEEMQVMLTLLLSLPKLIKSIGGPLSGLVLLQPLVETLPDRQKEETRQMYLKTISEIVTKMSQDSQAQVMAEQFLDGKVSQLIVGTPQEQLTCVHLIACLYCQVGQQVQDGWLQLYATALQQKDVKRKTISLLSEMFKRCSKTQDLVKVGSLITSHYGTMLELNKGLLLHSMPIVVQKKHLFAPLLYDNLMSIFEEVIQIDKPHIQTIFLDVVGELLEYGKPVIIQSYLRNLKLNDTETKNKSCALLEKVIRSLKLNADYQSIEMIVVRVTELINDKSTNTKLIVSENLMNLLKDDLYEKERGVFMKLLMDMIEVSDGEFTYKFLQKLSSFEVLLGYMKKSFKMSQMNDYAFKLCQIVSTIQTQKNWRMRQQCCIFIQKLCVDMAKSCVEDRMVAEFAQTIKVSLQDRIHQVREEAGKTLNILFRTLRLQQVSSHVVLQQMMELSQSPNYLIRVALTLGLKEAFMSLELSENTQLLISRASVDKVPNIKLALIETIFYQFQYKEDKKMKNYVKLFREVLQRFAGDVDKDVRDASSILITIF